MGNLMSGKIPQVPDVPPELIERINEEKLCFFIGAGVSKLIGCMGWKSVASNLVERCFKKGCINYKRRESILGINNPKKIITICYNILCDAKLKNDFFDVIEDALKPNPELLRQFNVYNELSGISAVYITTNIDPNFDTSFTNRIVYKEDDFDPANIFRDKLYKIHGTINDRDSLVFTLPQYFKRYKNSKFDAFLKKLFSEYSVFFLGYGLEEYEILDYLVTKFGEEENELKHWILLPYYQDEDYLLDYDKGYFRSLGIRVIGYEKDDKGYNQIFNVIKKWREEIREVSTVLYEDVKDLEETVDKL